MTKRPLLAVMPEVTLMLGKPQLAVMPVVTSLLVRMKQLDLDLGRVEDGPRDLPEVKCTRRRQ